MGTAANEKDRSRVAALVAKFERDSRTAAAPGESAAGLVRAAALSVEKCADAMPVEDGDKARRVTFNATLVYHEMHPEAGEECDASNE